MTLSPEAEAPANEVVLEAIGLTKHFPVRRTLRGEGVDVGFQRADEDAPTAMLHKQRSHGRSEVRSALATSAGRRDPNATSARW